MARSSATQAITLEWVKCRRGPRISQMPSSGSRQFDSRNSSRACWRSQAGSSLSRPMWRPRCRVSMHLAVDVELELVHGRVADPHRP